MFCATKTYDMTWSLRCVIRSPGNLWELTARGGTSGHESRTTVDAMLITPRLPIESIFALEPMLGQNTLAVSGSNMAVEECHQWPVAQGGAREEVCSLNLSTLYSMPSEGARLEYALKDADELYAQDSGATID
jgi:hypothetical protein